MKELKSDAAELVRLEKERVISHARLLKHGAYYTLSETGELILSLTKAQKDNARREKELTAKKEAIEKEIDCIKNAIDKKTADLEKEFLAPDKVKLREQLVSNFKLYALEVRMGIVYHYSVFRLACGEYIIIRHKEEKINLKAKLKGFIENNESGIILDLLGGGLCGCVPCSSDLINRVVSRICLADSSKRITVLTPCEDGGDCACSCNKHLSAAEKWRVDFNSAHIQYVPQFVGAFLSATGKELRTVTARYSGYPERFYARFADTEAMRKKKNVLEESVKEIRKQLEEVREEDCVRD